ncbi:MAG: putative hydrolase of the HAD superfamily [Candidatus Pseudothioglobus sp.]|jgi:putative hydrolase of the HAD superfamily
MYKAVLWDFGGVMTSSPFEAFNRFERTEKLPIDFIRSINSTDPETNAWAQLESASIDVKEFDSLFAAEASRLGHAVRGQQVLALLSGELRPEMVAALKLIKAKMKVGCITNNVKSAGTGAGMARDPERSKQFAAVMDLFDTVIESSKVGIRKPDPRIYQLACDKLSIAPSEAIFLDDLGINLKPARALGMTTIKVLNSQQALTELEQHLDMSLR